VTRWRVVTVTVGWVALAVAGLTVAGLTVVALVNRGAGVLVVGVLLLTAAAILWWPDRRNR
jgi:hypothetical protein